MIKEQQGVVAAHRHCIRNRTELEGSETSGCFHCLEIYPIAEIWEWIRETKEDEEHLTATCPKCGIDAVIGDASGYPVTDAKFLQRMKRRWFDV
ncbi:cytoplasmic protein [Rhizobium sp. CB3090]|uniref:cytoplasmic protein n=1 Tax=Rhizobium sp. CB3090 TaxID=3039156 RepID=UPI0024B282DB|nr:cytoplasmic protein [Rhizobium sp. CB3090]WFU10665.1 cytoplasmic protein [Rhizobium sp. CB3090]